MCLVNIGTNNHPTIILHYIDILQELRQNYTDFRKTYNLNTNSDIDKSISKPRTPNPINTVSKLNPRLTGVKSESVTLFWLVSTC